MIIYERDFVDSATFVQTDGLDGYCEEWPSFRLSEISCKCRGAFSHCHALAVETKLLDFLQAVRSAWGGPIKLNCAYRCPGHNADVYRELGRPNNPNSQHCKGLAADISREGLPDGFGAVLDTLIGDRGGFHEYPWGWHVDLRGSRARW